jgi:hypothetical protein
MRSCEKISQPSMLSSSRKTFALRTRYKRSLGMGDTLGVCRESAKTGRKVIFSHLPRNSASLIRGAAPETPRFIAVAPESLCYIGADCTAPAIPASGSTLRSHLCVALSSAQTFSEWKTSTQPCNDFSLNGRYPLNSLSHAKGSPQIEATCTPVAPPPTTTIEGGTSVRCQASLWVAVKSKPGIGSRRLVPPAQIMILSL